MYCYVTIKRVSGKDISEILSKSKIVILTKSKLHIYLHTNRIKCIKDGT